MAAAPIAVANSVEHLDQILDDHRHLLWRLAMRLGQRGRYFHDVHRKCLFSLAPFDNTELDSLTSLQARHPWRQRVGADIDVAAIILGQEAEALFGVVKPHLANRHVQTSLALSPVSGSFTPTTAR